ncbi:MAG TPA: 23S rRNA (guanosine(2251)-2'-O)-methyltransferase RlmB [Candidatus Dormibacteraeota bacterium]|nr:23S rRNA (guanosine(2251)-2'-O)-methyltransferase RlmB [Candidatus Dormibacteraeota bacterium]
MDILYGRNPVLEALRAGRTARKLVIAEGLQPDPRVAEIVSLAGSAAIAVEEVPRRRLDDIAHNEHHQGVAGYFHSRQPLQIEELLQRARDPALLLVLDGIQDPQNVGAITRTAEACGVDGIVLARRGSAAVTPAVAKTSAGASEHVPYAVAGNLARALDVAGQHGLRRVGLDAKASQRYDQVDYTGPLVVVLGAEGAGMTSAVRSACDELVFLPMLGRIESLNVGASAAVLLYEVQRQRRFRR